MNYQQKGKYISPEKRLSAVCKTSSLLRFPISVGRDPYVNYMHLSLLKYEIKSNNKKKNQFVMNIIFGNIRFNLIIAQKSIAIQYKSYENLKKIKLSVNERYEFSYQKQFGENDTVKQISVRVQMNQICEVSDFSG